MFTLWHDEEILWQKLMKTNQNEGEYIAVGGERKI